MVRGETQGRGSYEGQTGAKGILKNNITNSVHVVLQC